MRRSVLPAAATLLLLVACSGGDFSATKGDGGGASVHDGSTGGSTATGGSSGSSGGGTGGMSLDGSVAGSSGSSGTGSGGSPGTDASTPDASEDHSAGGGPGSGGTSGGGDSGSSGGSGGSTGTGGSSNTGGVPATGGTTSSGGTTSTGGTTATGGTTGSGGTQATGGVTGSGGTTSTGGATNTGGSGGSPPVCTPGDHQCFSGNRQTCDQAGHWIGDACDAGTPYCTGAGLCLECIPNQTAPRCLNGAPQTCDANGNWVTGADCFGACDNGSCQPLVLAQDLGYPGPQYLTVDSNYVYLSPSVLAPQPGVLKVPINGFTVTPVTTVNESGGLIRVVGSTLYYGSSSNGGGIATVPATGGTPTILVPGAQTDFWTMDSTSIYYTDNTGASVFRAALSGGTGTPLVTLTSPEVVAGFGSFAVDATDLYVGTVIPFGSGNGSIYKVALTGGSPVLVASVTKAIHGLVTDSTNIYWAEDNSGGIKKTPLAGGAVTTLYAAAASGERSFYPAVDGGYVYWFKETSTGSFLMKVPVNGGAAVPLATMTAQQGHGGNIAFDSTAVYWMTANGSVMKTNK